MALLPFPGSCDEPLFEVVQKPRRRRWRVSMNQPIEMDVWAYTSDAAVEAALKADHAIVGGLAIETVCCGVPTDVTVKEVTG